MMTARRNPDKRGLKSAETLVPPGVEGKTPERRALVVFSGSTDLKWLRMLRTGYRHCFALVQSEGCWILYNPLSNGTEIEVWPGNQEESLRAWLVQNGHEVIDEVVRPLDARALPWGPFSCVEAVKRVLGLRAPGVLTPWQLYRFLKKNEKQKKILDNTDVLGY